MREPDTRAHGRIMDRQGAVIAVLLGRRIKALRIQTNYSQADLAYLVGINLSVLKHIEAGERGMSFSMLYRIAAVLGVSAKTLLPMPAEVDEVMGLG